MGRGLTVLGLLLLIGSQAAAQNFPPIDAQTGAAPPIVRPKKPTQLPPGANSNDNTPATPQGANTPAAIGRNKETTPRDPAVVAAQRQSGLTEVQARSLLQQQGYASVNTLRAQPNSIWVWQADVIKNGRPIRLGIDYRGNVLELGATAAPCNLPGLSPTTGGFGVGARLSDASRCSGR